MRILHANIFGGWMCVHSLPLEVKWFCYEHTLRLRCIFFFFVSAFACRKGERVDDGSRFTQINWYSLSWWDTRSVMHYVKTAGWAINLRNEKCLFAVTNLHCAELWPSPISINNVIVVVVVAKLEKYFFFFIFTSTDEFSQRHECDVEQIK